MKLRNKVRIASLDWLIAAGFAAVAAVLYYAGLANFAYPGESANLMVLWRGLDVTETVKYPLMASFARLFGCGNALAPVLGVIATFGIYLLVTFFTRLRINGENLVCFATPASRIAGVTATILFMLAPAVRSAATHLEPRLFAVAWVVLSLLPFIGWVNARGLAIKAYPVLVGFLWGLGAIDSCLFAMLLPLLIGAVIAVPHVNGRRPYTEFALFFISLITTFIIASACNGGFIQTITTVWENGKAYTMPKGWAVILFFATIAFIVSLFSSGKAYNEQSGWVQWVFHIALGFCSILMIATPLSPSVLMDKAGILPCAACAYVACVAGYLLAYWWMLSVANVRLNESSDFVLSPVALKQRLFAYICGGVLIVVYVFMTFFNLFTFDSGRGAFADRFADRILDDLGDREWFVSDGSLDDHLLLRAANRGKELTLVSIGNDLNTNYLARLSKTVVEKGIGGKHNADLAFSSQLGVLPFVQDWFTVDPEAAKSVAIYGTPDLCYSAGLTPVPEFAFFGVDPTREPDWSAWKEFSTLLEVPKGWGSYQLLTRRAELAPVDRLRMSLRRNFGLVANDRGVWLQEQGRDDEAFDMYSLVLDEIDPDNVCALLNLLEMAMAKHPKAAAKRNEYMTKINKVVNEANHRHDTWSLARYYGYVRNPEAFVHVGYEWARSGRPGEALSQITRAIDLIPTDRRSALLNMMAAMYASSDNIKKSRETYEKVLAENADNHDALIGLMRLSLMDGDEKSALEYLDRATRIGGDDPRIRVEIAMAQMMRGDLVSAKATLRQVTESDATDLGAWSMMAAVTMQQCDAASDAAVKKQLENELEEKILPAMEKQARSPNDYYVQTTRAFILMRKGEEKRREARDAFVVASKSRPDIGATRDIVLGLDISLNDTAAAELHARETLRSDRSNPIANYVMGSLALRKGDYDSAIRFLHIAADARKPVVLAMNDLAEVYRRRADYDSAERYARLAIRTAPDFYVCYETLGSILIDRGGDLKEAQSNIERSVALSTKDGKQEDIRMLMSLARVQSLGGDKRLARVTLRKVEPRLGELSEYERSEYQKLSQSIGKKN